VARRFILASCRSRSSASGSGWNPAGLVPAPGVCMGIRRK
jgi:hypothetical protein